MYAYVCMCVCMRVCMCVCMYLGAVGVAAGIRHAENASSGVLEPRVELVVKLATPTALAPLLPRHCYLSALPPLCITKFGAKVLGLGSSV